MSKEQHTHSVEFACPRSVRHILVETLSAFREYPLLYMVTAACVVTVYDVVVLVITGHRPFGQSPEKFDLLSSGQGTAVLMITPVVSALYARIASIFSKESRSTQIHVAFDSFRILPIATMSQVIAYLGIGLAGIFFILPGLVLWLRWFVVAPVIAVEPQGIIHALRRSARLTADHYWHVLGLLLTLWVLVLVTTLCVHLIVAGSVASVGVVTLEIVVQTLITSYMALTIVGLYFDLCARSGRLASNGDKSEFGGLSGVVDHVQG